MTGKDELQPDQPADLPDPFPPGEFDDWAHSYDQDVLGGGFPFDGYAQVLATMLRLAEVEAGQSVLDLGVGTGNLSLLFAQSGCLIYGTDYSAQMLERAHHKLPQAVFLQADLRQTWPEELDRPFDRIVSAYVFHHFELIQKVSLLTRLSTLLATNGRMLIADLAFTNQLAMQVVQQAAGSTWEEEFYWNAEETLPVLAQAGLVASFQPVSSCAGVFVIPKP
jgi:putative AdoMet-dependent methyltransferase